MSVSPSSILFGRSSLQNSSLKTQRSHSAPTKTKPSLRRPHRAQDIFPNPSFEGDRERTPMASSQSRDDPSSSISHERAMQALALASRPSPHSLLLPGDRSPFEFSSNDASPSSKSAPIHKELSPMMMWSDSSSSWGVSSSSQGRRESSNSGTSGLSFESFSMDDGYSVTDDIEDSIDNPLDLSLNFSNKHFRPAEVNSRLSKARSIEMEEELEREEERHGIVRENKKPFLTPTLDALPIHRNAPERDWSKLTL
ncbi:hypothetical protein BT69DRAFT_1277169 [Atractiella rhizophila]|nr:hypothetical protein BT69DRAFT_1277169 [Atractiella rhizophila]